MQAFAVAAPPASSPCFGAASHDSRHPCQDPHLRYVVTPSPADATITPNAPCTLQLIDDGVFHPVPGGGRIPLVCVFGTPPPASRYGVALVGDSHAETWRAALAVVANSLHWEGASITRSSCPYMRASPVGPERVVAECRQWRQGVVTWFQANPQVETMFAADHATARIVPTRGRTAVATAVAGYLAAWRALPVTVKHIVVLRDTPDIGDATGPCVQAAADRHAQAGIICAVRRRLALARDPAVAAAAAFAPRAEVIDMTRFFCDRARCNPVIGGVLVYKDSNHMTRRYSETLGPYLGNQVRRLAVSWG